MNLRCRKREREYWHGILFEEPNQNREPPKRPNWAVCMSKRARGKENTQPAEKSSRGGGEANRGSTAARPTLTRDWGGPRVRDPMPVVSVNPGADPPHPRAPIRPNWVEQGRGRKKRSRRGNGGDVDAGAADAEKKNGQHQRQERGEKGREQRGGGHKERGEHKGNRAPVFKATHTRNWEGPV